MIYDFGKKIDRLNTHSYKWDSMGGDYLPLWVADADFEIPPAVTERLKKRLEHKVFGYYRLETDILETLSEWFVREMGTKLGNHSWIHLVPAIVPALAVASNIGGGRSITTIPNYCCLLDAPGNAGNELIRVPLKNDDERYSIDFSALEEAITDDVKVFYLCNPHNPVGRVYTMDELLDVSAFARKHNLIVISDEAHCELVYEGKHIPFFTVDEYAREHSITLYSNGKMCNVPDVILAFAIIPNVELRKEFKRLSYAFENVHSLNIEAGIASYAESKEWKEQLLQYLKQNRDYLERR